MNVGDALALVNGELRSKRTLRASMKRLVSHTSLATEIDFAADAEALAFSLGALVEKMRPGVTGLVFFLDDGGGIDAMSCTGWAPGADIETWTDTARPTKKLRSRALRTARDGIADNAAEYAICLGYLGLALRDGFRAIGAASIERAIAWGHHDGDMFLLGVHGRRGFRLTLQPEEEAAKKGVPKPPLPKLAPAPRASTEPRDWLVRAGLLWLGCKDGYRRALQVADDLLAVGARRDASALALGAAAFQAGTPTPAHQDMGIDDLASCAAALGRVGERAAGIAMLEEACRLLPTVRDDFWAKHARSSIANAAEELTAHDVLAAHGIAPRPALESKPAAPARSAKTLMALAATELAALRTSQGNGQGAFSKLVRLAQEVRAHGDHAALATLAALAADAAKALDLRAGWIATSVLADLAVLHHWADDAARAEELLVEAEKAAAKERRASLRETATISLREAFDHVQQPDRPITRYQASRDVLREIRALVRRDDLHAAERLIAAELDPTRRAAMLGQVARCLVALHECTSPPTSLRLR